MSCPLQLLIRVEDLAVFLATRRYRVFPHEPCRYPMYAVGTSTSVMAVANSTSKPSETAIGTMKEASRLLFHINGARPKKVVSDVSRIGRKRWTPASRTASAKPAVSKSRRSVGLPRPAAPGARHRRARPAPG